MNLRWVLWLNRGLGSFSPGVCAPGSGPARSPWRAATLSAGGLLDLAGSLVMTGGVFTNDGTLLPG
jgi:hypothetical protein